MIFLYVVISLVVLLFLWIIAVFNGLITLKNRTDEAWSDIDVQLKRRYDLIPNLMETVKGYASHEKEVFARVSEARSAAMGAKGPEDKAKAEGELSGALKSLFAVAEAYPDLKSSQNFLQLQDELSDTENKIQAARRFYNGNARDLNIRIQQFPSNLVANALKFKKREFFEVESKAEREAPEVKF